MRELTSMDDLLPTRSRLPECSSASPCTTCSTADSSVRVETMTSSDSASPKPRKRSVPELVSSPEGLVLTLVHQLGVQNRQQSRHQR